MSFSVGSGLLTAHISHHRLYDIKESSSPPEISLWEKIKHFFFSTHQKEALSCVYKLYHHESLNLSEQEIRDTFIRLKTLASPDCRNKFVIDRSISEDIYKINDEVILSVPRAYCDSLSNSDEDIWYDCLSENDIFQDSTNVDIWSDCLPENDIFQERSGVEYNGWIRFDFPASVIADDKEPEQAQKINLDSDVSQTVKQPVAEKTSIITNESVLSDDELYIQSVKILMPEIEYNLLQRGRGAIIKEIGLFKSVTALWAAERIDKNIKSDVINATLLKKDINTLLKIPNIIKLIPPSITRTPEYSIILKNLL